MHFRSCLSTAHLYLSTQNLLLASSSAITLSLLVARVEVRGTCLTDETPPVASNDLRVGSLRSNGNEATEMYPLALRSSAYDKWRRALLEGDMRYPIPQGRYPEIFGKTGLLQGVYKNAGGFPPPIAVCPYRMVPERLDVRRPVCTGILERITAFERCYLARYPSSARRAEAVPYGRRT